MNAPRWLIRPNEDLESWEINQRAQNWASVSLAALSLSMLFGNISLMRGGEIALTEASNVPNEHVVAADWEKEGLLIAETASDFVLCISAFKRSRQLNAQRTGS